LGNATGAVTLKMARLNEFMVSKLPNFPRSLLGFEFDEDDLGQLVIRRLGPKANASLQPDVELRPGDAIVTVNGNCAFLKAEVASHDVLTLRIRRSGRFGGATRTL